MNKNKFNIKLATKKEYHKLADLWEETVKRFMPFISEEDIHHDKRKFLEKTFEKLNIKYIEQDDKIAGFVAVISKDIILLFVDKNHMNKGIGSELVLHAISQLHAKYTSVNEKNNKAIKFYERMGFHEVGRTESRLSDSNYVIVHMKLNSWKFGSNDKQADDLLNLVLEGKKTATSSIYNFGENIKVGDVSYITDSAGNPRVMIRTTNIMIERFCDVTEDFARREGEGDLSLGYWRDSHRKFFSNEIGITEDMFDEETALMCEEFEIERKF